MHIPVNENWADLASHEKVSPTHTGNNHSTAIPFLPRETQDFASLLYANSATIHPSISAANSHTATYHHPPRHPQLIFLTSANSTFSVLRSTDSKFLSIFAVCYMHAEIKEQTHVSSACIPFSPYNTYNYGTENLIYVITAINLCKFSICAIRRSGRISYTELKKISHRQRT